VRISGFSQESWNYIETLLFEEHDLTGQCDQKEKRKRRQMQRTPAQKQADKIRSQEMKNQPQPGNRSEAAKKSAQTRKKCHGTHSVHP
jgi:cell division protein FtsN